MLTIDITGATDARIGDAGLAPPAFAAIRASAIQAVVELEETRGTDWERWRLLFENPMRAEHLSAVDAAIAAHGADTRNLVVLGIGGSALGAIAVQSALNPSTWNLLPDDARGGPRLFVLDNVDPSRVKETLDFLAIDDPGFEATTLVVVSKSGETAETAAQFLVFREAMVNALGPVRAAARTIAITDPAKGTMRSICDAAGYRTLPVPDGVGGRFSVLSPVGLLPAAFCGIDVRAMLDGAAAMEERCRSMDPEANPAANLAAALVGHGRRGRSIHVLMPYCDALHDLADWYRQLWAESLGKATGLDGTTIHAGYTPVHALGATDQHSQIQLYREGPDDKVIGLIAVEDLGPDVAMPAAVGEEPLSYLAGSTLGTLLDAERRATEFALAESRRPTYTIRIPRVDAHHVGEFIQLWQVATAIAGLMLGVDAYDQPAVETGKKATFGLMGRAGFEAWRERVDG